MKVLLSPAKNLDFTKSLKTDLSSTPVFLKEAQELMGKLKKLSPKKIQSMMHLSTDLAELNHTRFQNWTSDVELSAEHNHAIAVFNGEVYRGFDAMTLSKEELQRAQNNLRILSGLYGILKPLDVIAPYRLEMGTKWSVTPSKKNLYQFWGNKVTNQLKLELDDNIIVNLASTEYAKVVQPKLIKGRIVTPIFKEFKNGEYKVIMIFAKRARGTMARYIIENDITNVEEIKYFNVDGYRFDENLSKGDEWVFTR